ncbi:hypothetical protein BsWGS_25358 [Bradybaena similaris]
MSLLLKAFMLALIIPQLTCHSVTCHKGQKSDFKGAHICNICDNGTFMPEDEHNKTECYPCTQVRDENEVVIRECSAEEDALIVCKAGLFRDGGTCKQCTVCEAGHEIQPCDSHRDTICCPSDNFYVDVNADGRTVCKVRTLPCRQEQFLVSGHNCTSCPPGTYMVDNHHSYNACISCQQLPNNHEINEYVARVCNITCSSSSVGGCRDGLTPNTGRDIHIVDLNKTDNVSDKMSTTPSVKNVEQVFHILRIVVYAAILIVFLSGLVLVKCMSVRIERIKLLKEYLADKGGVLATSMFAVMFALVVSFLFISSVPTENDFHIFIHVVHLFAALCVCAMFVIAILCLLLIQHHTEKLSCDSEFISFHSGQAHKCSVTHNTLSCMDADCSCCTLLGHTTSPSLIEVPATHSVVKSPLQQ